MKTRIVLGTLLVSLLAGLFIIDRLNESRTIMSVLIIVLGLAAWCEIAILGGVGDRARGGGLALFLTGFGASAYLLIVAWLEGSKRIGDSLPADAGLAISLLLLFACVVFRRDHTAGFQPLLVAILGVVLIGFLFSYTLRIYHLPDGPLIGAVLVGGIKGNDIAAYFIGRLLGKRRVLWVSPRKTLEGCAAGIIFSAFWFAGAALAWPEVFFPWPWCFLLGIIIAIAAQVGDLSKSLIKRFYQVKDSAKLLPEFGGVLDLIDSALFSGFLYWVPFSITAAGAGSFPG
jgi:phosphatidate cytidylyltransferase